MALASLALRQYLSSNPKFLPSLSSDLIQFLRWLIEKFEGPRAYSRWIAGLGEFGTSLRAIPYEDFYPTQVEARDVQGQIEELIALVTNLGLEQILTLVDVEPTLSKSDREKLSDLFGWLELMHHPGFTLIAAVPTNVYKDAELARKARDRVNVTPILWTPENIRLIAERHVQAATDGQILKMESLVSRSVLTKLEQVLDSEFSEPTPRAWVDLSRVMLERDLGALPARELDSIKREYYARCLRLWLDPSSSPRGVWRGARFIPLEEQPFNFLRVLWLKKGEPVSLDELRSVAEKKNNVHRLAHRVRQAIEPDPSDPIYVKSKRNEGYWIEED